MKNYCTSYYLYHVTSRGKEYPVRRAYSRSTVRNFAAKLGLSNFCICTIRTEDGIDTVLKKEYYYGL